MITKLVLVTLTLSLRRGGLLQLINYASLLDIRVEQTIDY